MIRVATYNVHRCRGMDRRVSVARITDVIAGLDADVVAVQEILRGDPEEAEEADQVAFIAEALGYEFAFGENRPHGTASLGNATFSRLPIVRHANYDLTWHRRDRKGCLRTDLRLPSHQLFHVYNVHLGVSFLARSHQARRLVSRDVLKTRGLTGPRVVMGDFNEWTRGLATRLMGEEFESVDMALLGRRRTYPGLFPVFHLDHFYYDPALRLVAFRLERSRLARLASDHLPLVAEFDLT
jgi:endonuclease/exonuclease/phosphatase family metal-dependent hydrolase